MSDMEHNSVNRDSDMDEDNTNAGVNGMARIDFVVQLTSICAMSLDATIPLIYLI